LIESASDSQINVHPEPDYWDHLESQHYELWKQEKHKHIDRTIEVAEYKKQSLKTSHQALVASVIDRMKQVTDEKILRMYRSQLASLQAAHERNIQELDIAVEKADIVTTPVMYGIIRISREEV